MRDWKFNHIDFSTYPHYNGDDLGVHWSPEKTLVKIWAPTARSVEFRLFKNGKSGEAFYKTQLQSSGDGTWATILNGDYEGKFYTFRVDDGGWLDETPDIYARCVGINGRRGMIFNPSKTNPDNWENDKRPELNRVTDAIIYETHVRDFTISPDSGIQNKGKYKGFTEKDTTCEGTTITGLSHLIELGITHVHLLPVSDFFTVDEEEPLLKYNWGYDPLNFNAPEGSYSTNPYDGTARIKELKSLVQSLHSEGIGVILDVVYNHTYFAKESAFNQTVPGYFYRQKPDGTFANGSGCGNEIATERSMVRKFIIDSLKYWAEEYHIDGFRFDLMGIYDIETMKAIRNELNKTVAGLILYGEGWAAAESPMSEEFRAVKKNIAQMPGIAAFNDDFRDALRGNHSNKKTQGFISGLGFREEAIKFGIVGSIYHPQIVYDYVDNSKKPWAENSNQCINYASCHDNYTLWDKLKLSNPKSSDDDLRKMVMLAGALILTSQGIPFIHSGMEFCRTKGGNGNSYKSSDSINQIDWKRKTIFLNVFEYYKKLIKLRKDHPAFRMGDSSKITNYLNFCSDYKPGIIVYYLKGEAVKDTWQQIILLFNGNKETMTIPVPEAKYKIIARNCDIVETGMEELVTNEIDIPGISMILMLREDLS